MKPIIRVENLSKQYRIGAKQAPYSTLRDSLTNAVTASFRRFQNAQNSKPETRNSDTIWALKNVSFEVYPGEVVGIIGRNGAGKSTLLKILSRITEPTEGRVDLYGRVGSLLEVGTGFHPELTGRENIYLNGAILGMKRAEIERHFDEIVAFAEVEQFIDTPVKHYSSGMYLRLAFAVAAHLDPEILVVDEVLAVGDIAFQEKCLGRMEHVARQGRTIFFVSHNLSAISSLCNKAYLLASGMIAQEGIATEVIRYYLSSLEEEKENDHGEVRFTQKPDLAAQLLAIRLVDKNGNRKKKFDIFEPVTVEIDYVIRKPSPGMLLELYCLKEGTCLFSSFDTDASKEKLESREPGFYRATHQIPAPLLRAGGYELFYGMGIINIGPVHTADQMVRFQIIEGGPSSHLVSYIGSTPGKIIVPIEWRISRLC